MKRHHKKGLSVPFSSTFLMLLLALTIVSGFLSGYGQKSQSIPDSKSVAAPGEISSQALSQSKLGVFMLQPSSGGAQIAQAGPRVIRVMDAQQNASLMSIVRDYKSKFPDGIVVLRNYTPDQHYSLSDDPAASADDYWNRGLLPELSKLSASDKALIDYVSGPNEYDNCPAFKTSEDAAWFAKFWVRLADLMAQNGFRPNMADISVGNPADPGIIESFAPALLKAKEVGGVWSYHAYSKTNSTDEATENNLSLRYRQLHNIVSGVNPELSSLPMILTEGGLDDKGRGATDGWNVRISADEYRNWLTWFDSQIQNDPYVLGVTLFQIGNSTDWRSFNLEEISNWLSGYISGQPGGTNPTQPPVATSIPIPNTPIPSPTISNLQPTITETISNPTPTQELIQPTSTPIPPTTGPLTPTTYNLQPSFTPTPTKSLITIIVSNPLFEVLKSISKSLSELWRVMLP